MAVPLKTPNAALIIRQAIMNALRECAPIVKNNASANLNRVLRRKSGQLASTIYTKVTRRQRGGCLTVGTPVHYGRFWEFGFLRGKRGKRLPRRRSAALTARLIKAGAKFEQRPFLRPAADQAMPEVYRRVETHLARVMNQLTGTVSIDIKIT